MSIEGILRGCMLQGWRYSPLAWSHRSLLNGTRSTGSQIGIGGSPNRPPAALGLCQVFPHPVLMKPNRIGVSDDELIWIQAFDENWTRHTPLSSIHEDDHEFRLSARLGRLLGGGEFSL